MQCMEYSKIWLNLIFAALSLTFIRGQEAFPLFHAARVIGHFRVPLGLCIKTMLGAQPLIWKWFFILMQIKLISTRKVEHLSSFWYRGPGELGNGLLSDYLEGKVNFPEFKKYNAIGQAWERNVVFGWAGVCGEGRNTSCPKNACVGGYVSGKLDVVLYYTVNDNRACCIAFDCYVTYDVHTLLRLIVT